VSALDEIMAALKAAKPLPGPDWERAVLVGISAQRSINADVVRNGDEPMEEIDGVMVLTTLEFDGWEIRQIGPEGRWEDVEAA
jgi:hypothetical protein